MRALILALSIIGNPRQHNLRQSRSEHYPSRTAGSHRYGNPSGSGDRGSDGPHQGEASPSATRSLARLGYEAKVSGRFDNSTRAAIAGWQDEHGYPRPGFLDITQHRALSEEGAAAMKTSESDPLDHRRGRGRVHRTRVVGGPFGAIGHAIGGLFRR